MSGSRRVRPAKALHLRMARNAIRTLQKLRDGMLATFLIRLTLAVPLASLAWDGLALNPELAFISVNTLTTCVAGAASSNSVSSGSRSFVRS